MKMYLLIIFNLFILTTSKSSYGQYPDLQYSSKGSINVYYDSLVYVKSINGIYHKIERTEDTITITSFKDTNAIIKNMFLSSMMVENYLKIYNNIVVINKETNFTKPPKYYFYNLLSKKSIIDYAIEYNRNNEEMPLSEHNPCISKKNGHYYLTVYNISENDQILKENPIQLPSSGISWDIFTADNSDDHTSLKLLCLVKNTGSSAEYIYDEYKYEYSSKKINATTLSPYSISLASKSATPRGFVYPSIKNFHCIIKKTISPSGHKMYDYIVNFSGIPDVAKHIQRVEYQLPADGNGIIKTFTCRQSPYKSHFTSFSIYNNRQDGYIIAHVYYDFKVDNDHVSGRNGDHAQDIVIYLNDFDLIK